MIEASSIQAIGFHARHHRLKGKPDGSFLPGDPFFLQGEDHSSIPAQHNGGVDAFIDAQNQHATLSSPSTAR